jgi:aminopeptidase N
MNRRRAFLLHALLLAACAKQAGMLPDRHLAFGDPENLHRPERLTQIDVHHYAIEVVPDFDERQVHGAVEITFTPKVDKPVAVHFDAGDMRIHDVTVNGRRVTFTHRQEILAVQLVEPVRSTDRAVCRIRYTALPNAGLFFILPDRAYPDKPRQVWTQGEPEYNHHWFPCWDHPADRATAELWITTPEPMVAISNGALVERSTIDVTDLEALAIREGQARASRPHVPAVPSRAGRYHLWHWKMDREFVSYLISMAIGEFDIFEQTVVLGDRAIPLRYNVPKGSIAEADVQRLFGKTPDMMQFFSERFGVPFPYPKYDQTLAIDFTWGGMENITATTLNGDLLISAARPGSGYSPEGLIAHELAHSWFGDLVTCRDWSHIWLNETFATFFTHWWFRESQGPAEFEYQIWQAMQGTFGQDRRYERPVVNDNYTDPDDMFDTRSYEGGAVMINQLRHVMGDDAFFNGIHTYLGRHAWTSVGTDRFIDAMEFAAGRDLDWFFDQWIFGTLYPEFKVAAEWDAPNRVLRLKVDQTHAVTERRRLFRTPVDVGLTAPDGKVTMKRVEVDEARETFLFELPEKPVFVDFDAGSWIYKKLSFEKSLDELLWQAEKDADVAGRIWAIDRLAERNDARAALEKAALGDPFYGVRIRAIQKLSDPASMEVLKKARQDQDTRVRAAAIRALAEHPGCEELVAESARTDASLSVAQAAAGSLHSFDTIQAVLKDRGHEQDVVVGAIGALIPDGDPRGYDVVAGYAAYGRPAWIRDNAVDALASWAGKESPRRAEAQALLQKLLDDPEFRIRRAGIGALGAAGDTAAIPWLQERAREEPDARLRRAARMAVHSLRTGG